MRSRSAANRRIDRPYTKKSGTSSSCCRGIPCSNNLAYQVEGDKVILYGQVTRPSLKSDAEAAVKSIEGVSSVREQHRGSSTLADG